MKKLSLFGVVGVLVAAGVFAVSASVFAAPATIFSDGFESAGNLTGWTANSHWTEVASTGLEHSHSGSRMARIKGPTGPQNDYLTQTISTVGYQNVTVSYWYRVSGVLGPLSHFKAQYSTDGGTTWTTLSNHYNEILTSWNQETFSLPASANNNANLKLRFVGDMTTSINEVRLDDIAVTGDSIPETTTTTVVHSGDLYNDSSSPVTARANAGTKWFEYNDTTDTLDNTLGSFVAGPSTAPAGSGSIQFKLAASNSRSNIATYQFAGTKLADIYKLSYSAYSHSGVAGVNESPYFNFNIDLTGSNSWQGRLVYLPSANGAVPQDAWNTFDTINNGNGLWSWSRFAANGNKWPDGNTSEYRTWSDIKAAFPNAQVLSTDSWMGVRVGEPGPTNYVGNVDNFTISTYDGSSTYNTKTFDFEPYQAPSCDGSTTFDTFTTGSVSGQGGWMGSGIPVNPAYDQAVVDNTYNIPSFGCKTLRLSDAVTSGSFGDWIFTPSVADEAGETSAYSAGFSTGSRGNHFVAQFDFASAQALGLQPGQHVSISPDRGDGSRMSYVRLVDQSDGIHVYFDDVPGGQASIGTPNEFNETDIATLDRTTPHTIKFDMTFVDGPSNDIVKVYVDGTLKITGTSWEDYYRYDPEQAGNGNVVPTVDSLIIQARGSADPANLGKGFLFDNFNVSSNNIPGSIHITKYECPAGTTVNRTSNGVGGTVPTGCVPQQGAHFGYVGGPQPDAGAPYPEFSAPVTASGTTDANGELTIANLSATGRYAVFELDSNDQKVADSALFGMYCTGDADPNPNHNDNGDLTFVPAGGSAQCVAYNPDTTAPGLPTHLSPADNSTVTTAALDHIDWSDVTDTVSNPVTYLYEVSNSSATNPDGSFVSTAYVSGTLTDSQILTPGTPEGQYYWHVRAVDAAGNMSAWTAPWHITVDNTPPTYQVHIVKYIDGAHATADSANFLAFSMQATYSGTSQELGVINGSNPYNLDAAGNYEATTLHLAPGFHYGTSENMNDAVGASCSDGKPFALAGYSVGSTLSEAETNGSDPGMSLTAPDFTDLQSNEYVIVWNVSCKPAPVATVTTNAATNITASDAQLNGHNGGSDAQGHSFWVSTSPFSTSSPSIPVGVYSTPDMGAVAANTDFNANLSVVTTSGVPSNMPAIQPNTTYYFVAWVNVGGTWYPGDELSFTTGDGSPTPTPGVTTNNATGVSQTDATLNATVGAVDADAESFWVSTSSYDTSTPNIPAGVYSTPVLSGVAANGTFSDALSLVTTNGITTGGVPSNMPAITPGTTYYYNAWAHVNGTWYPGAIKTVTTDSVPPPPEDTTTPVLTLIGGNPLHIKVGSTYVDPGVTISDTPTNNLGYTIATDGAATTSSNTFTLDTSTEGTHVLTYSATDGAGHTGTVTRTVIVDGTSPTVVLTSDSSNPTTDNPIHVTATFSEEVSGFDQTDIAASSASISNFQASSTNPLVYTFDVIPTGSSITVSVAEHKYTDLAGNENQSQADFSRTIGSNTPENTAPTGSGSNGGGGGNGSPSIFGLTVGGGLVLGTSTVNSNNQSAGTCSPLITTYMGLGRKNNAGQVKLLQGFLNTEMSATLVIDGIFGETTDQVVRQFQLKYKDDILTPWGISEPTGYVYKLTQKKINEIHCAQ